MKAITGILWNWYDDHAFKWVERLDKRCRYKWQELLVDLVFIIAFIVTGIALALASLFTGCVDFVRWCRRPLPRGCCVHVVPSPSIEVEPPTCEVGHGWCCDCLTGKGTGCPDYYGQ